MKERPQLSTRVERRFNTAALDDVNDVSHVSHINDVNDVNDVPYRR